MNESRIEQLKARRAAKTGWGSALLQFNLGDEVSFPGYRGIIDAAFADLDSAIAAGLVDPSWYASSGAHQTKPDERWYSVVTDHGAELCGEQDLFLNRTTGKVQKR